MIQVHVHEYAEWGFSDSTERHESHWRERDHTVSDAAAAREWFAVFVRERVPVHPEFVVSSLRASDRTPPDPVLRSAVLKYKDQVSDLDYEVEYVLCTCEE